MSKKGDFENPKVPNRDFSTKSVSDLCGFSNSAVCWGPKNCTNLYIFLILQKYISTLMKMFVREMHIAHITYLFISSKGLQLNRVSAQKPAKQIEAAAVLLWYFTT